MVFFHFYLGFLMLLCMFVNAFAKKKKNGKRADLSPKNRELVEFHLRRSRLTKQEIAEKVKILQKLVNRINQVMMKNENLTPNRVGKCGRKKKFINSQMSTDKNLMTPMSGNRKLKCCEPKKKTSVKRLDSPLSRKLSVENQATKISPDLSPRKKAMIACLLEESLFMQRQIAKKANVSQATVCRIS